MGILFLRINEKNFERYKRTYPKFQSLIADVISTIQFILLIYDFLSNNIYSKKIDIEIIKSILYKNYEDKKKINSNDTKEEDNKIQQIKLSTNTYDGNRKFEEMKLKNNNNIITNNKFMEDTRSDRPIRKNKNKGFKFINKIKNKIKIINNNNNDNNNNLLLEEMNKINFWNILFYNFSCCFKRKRKIVNKCSEFIDKELSIDIIIDKILKLEDINLRKEGNNKRNNILKEIIELLKGK